MIDFASPSVAIPEIMDIAPYKPGKSKLQGRADVIKLSSNENPFGMSPKALKTMQEATALQHRYPDGGCTALREAIAEQHGIQPEHIVCGAGSDELIALLCQAYAGRGDEVLYSQHGFLMYPISALRVGATPVTAPETNLTSNVDNLLAAANEQTKLVFIANPNNPTGSYLTKQEMRRLRAGLPDHTILVIDAAYAEYVTEEDYSSGLGMVPLYDNTVMLRTFSKIYGLGGLRLGWAFCPPAIADVLNRVRGPFNVSDIAQHAGTAAMLDQDFITTCREHNSAWLPKLTDALQHLGIKVHPSVGNFILAEFADEATAIAADAHLHEHGIIGRMMQSYGLPACMRYTIGKDDENTQLIAALTSFMHPR